MIETENNIGMSDVVRPLRVLLVEDQEDDADLIQRALYKGGIAFEAHRVDDRAGFEKEVLEFNPDVILSDHSLPQFNSIEALNFKMNKKPFVPFILVTGAVSDEFAVQCIKRGADDYILKSNLSRLALAVKNAIEHRNSERLRAEGENAIRERNIQLVRAHKEIDSFVYSLSHNLRSPLSSVLGLVNLAKMEVPSSNTINTMKYLNLIEGSIMKLDETIKEIMEYFQNERIDLNIEPINLKETIDECIAKYQFTLNFSQITKQINVSGPVPFYSDRFRISVILTNLLSNAFKYVDERKDHKVVRIKAVVNESAMLLEVTDNGIGIGRNQLPLVFNMFYRGTERSSGAGLGLYIVKEVVDRLDGTVSLVSEPELLTTVTISIPNHPPKNIVAAA